MLQTVFAICLYGKTILAFLAPFYYNVDKTARGVAVVSDMELRLEPKQVLQVSPQMLLATRMLLMPAQELSDYLARAAEENPLLEMLEPAAFPPAAKGHMPSSLRIRRRSDGGTPP